MNRWEDYTSREINYRDSLGGLLGWVIEGPVCGWSWCVDSPLRMGSAATKAEAMAAVEAEVERRK